MPGEGGGEEEGRRGVPRIHSHRKLVQWISDT